MWPWQKRTLGDVVGEIPLEVLRRRAKIAVIDDDPTAFPTELLQKEGYTIQYLPEVESLDPLERGQFDIIILDIRGVAPQWSGDDAVDDGLAVLEHLKDRNPSQVVVAFSGETFDLSKSRFWKLADDTLSKPVDALKAKRCIDDLLVSTMTPMHYWEGARSVLLAHGATPRAVSRLEAEVAKALRSGRPPDIRAITERICKDGDAVLKVGVLIAKVVALLSA